MWQLREAAVLSPPLRAEVVAGVCKDVGTVASGIGNTGTGRSSGRAPSRRQRSRTDVHGVLNERHKSQKFTIDVN